MGGVAFASYGVVQKDRRALKICEHHTVICGNDLTQKQDPHATFATDDSPDTACNLHVGIERSFDLDGSTDQRLCMF